MFTADYHMDAEAYVEAAREAWLEHTGEWYLYRPSEDDADKFFKSEFPLLVNAENEVEARFDELAYGDPILLSDGLELDHWERLLVEWTHERAVGNFILRGVPVKHGNTLMTFYEPSLH